MRNLPIDLRNLGIFLNKQGHSFQFSKKSIGDLPLLLVVRACRYIFRFLCLLPKNAPDVSRIYGSYFGWRVKYSMPRKTNFVNELMEVWRTLRTNYLVEK